MNMRIHHHRAQFSGKVTWAVLFVTALTALIVGSFVLRAHDGTNHTASSSAATVVTDKLDYPPGATAYITGAGFEPGENVSLQVLHKHIDGEPHVDDSGEDHDPWVIIANSTGGFTTTWHVCEDDCVGATLELTATGLRSTRVAKAIFTDANYQVYAAPVGAPDFQFDVTVVKTEANQTITTTSGSVLNDGSFRSFVLTNSNEKAVLTAGSVQGRTFINWTFVAPHGQANAVVVTNNTTTPPIVGAAGSSVFKYYANYSAPVATTTTTTISGPGITSSPSITYGANGAVTVTVSAAVGTPTPTGSVTLNVDNGAQFLSQPLESGSTTFTLTTPTATSHPLSAVYSPTNSFSTSTGTGTLVVAPAAVTVVISGGPFTYDGLPHGATVVTTPTSISHTVNYSRLSPAYNSETAPTNAGTYAVDVTITNTNYVLSGSGSGSIVINKATPTTTLAVSNSPQTYNNTAKSATVTVSASSTPGAAANVLTGAAATQTDAATYAVTADFVPTDTTNYNTLTGLSAGNFVIDPAPVTVVISGGPFTYDGLPHGATVVTTPAGISHTVNYSRLLPVYNSAAAPANAGTYAVDVTISNPNYALSGSGTGSITINKAAATLTLNASDLLATYNGSPKTVGVSSIPAGLAGVSVTYAESATAPTNAGSYAVVASLDNANYEAPNATGTLLIKKAATTTVIIVGSSFVYTGSPILGAAVTVTGGILSLNPPANYSNNTNAGTATASYSYAGDLNHEASSDTKNFTIEKAPSTTTVTITGAPFAYTGLAQTPASVTVTGAGGLSLTPPPTYMNNVNSGTATASYTYVGDSNHEPSSDSKNFIIGKASATIEFTESVQAYTTNALKPVASLKRTSSPYPQSPYPQANVTFTFDPAPTAPATSPSAVGVYAVTATVSDPNFSADPASALFVIYDPNGGFVTGGGWINSPKDALSTYGASLLGSSTDTTGKANFGFTSKYQKGAKIPTGQTQFEFKAGNLNFHSTSYEWLTVAGARAQYKGEGTINGAGTYGFMLTAIDGQVSGGGGTDKFRIKIWDKASGNPVYDNQNGADDAGLTTPGTLLGGGSIVIHDGSKK